MFFRRMFQRKDTDDNTSRNDNTNDTVDDETLYYKDASQCGIKAKKRTHLQEDEFQLHRSGVVTSSPRAQRKFGGTRKPSSSASTLHYPLDSTADVSFVQLTPLWEHILRTRTLPDSICPQKMFAEFLERLRDPEWQVRQHALRVLVDVLVVMGAKADTFMDPLVGQLVENLGHQAPTVRKGALDCLRVYLAETAMPETIMLQILDIGLNQRITNEPFGGRLTCGVMLSLPALVQSTLHTNKRHFILRSAVDMLVLKMGQVTHQEITLKVLSKIRELIGHQEFVALLSNSAHHEFELLCSVYGLQQLPTTATSSGDQLVQRDGSSSTPSHRHPYYHAVSHTDNNGWRISGEEQMLKKFPGDKVILETEIKINDETLTMRILEAKDTDTDGTDSICMDESPKKDASRVDSYLSSLEDEVVCGRLDSARNSIESIGVIRLLSDSEMEEVYRNRSTPTTYVGIVTPSTPTRTPKRVTFGGEIVKMRTPDSDANSSNNNTIVDNNNDRSTESFIIKEYEKEAEIPEKCESDITNPLSLEILNDNTKPVPRSINAETLKFDKAEAEEHKSSTPPSTTISPSPKNRELSTSNSPNTRRKDSTASLSPRSPFKRISISPVDSIISPKVPHKEIEVLHNLQRDPSPVRARRASIRSTEDLYEDKEGLPDTRSRGSQQVLETAITTPPPSSWEDLGIVDEDVLMDLRAGDWRCRSQGIHSLQEALRSSDNLARVQPCLDTLLRVLLSSEHHPEVAESKRRLLINLISRLPLDNLEDRTLQIMTGLCRQGGAGAHRVCKALMQRLPPAAIVLKLLSDEFLHAKSSRFREHALQMVMYALMAFPSTCFDTTTCVTNATFAALDRKKRVRQAALDVLAVLGQLTSARAVLDVVQRIATTRDEGPALLAGVKARLGRKQLPLVTDDGTIQYTVRVPSPSHQLEAPMNRSGSGEAARLGADIDWIIGGIGSVSPTSMKRRAQKHRSSSQQSFSRLADQAETRPCFIGGSNHSEETCSKYNSTRSSREKLLVKESGRQTPGKDDTQPQNVQYALGSGAPLHFGIATKKCNVDFANFVNRRMVAKSCSDSSMDGRSSDSTYTSSSGGGGGCGVGGAPAVAAVGCAASKNEGGISGRFTRQQTVNSRFPAMNRMNLNATYVRAQKAPTCYPGMGAYAQLQQQQYNMNTMNPKVNYGLSNGKRRQHNTIQQQQQQLQSQQHQQLQSQQRLCFNSQENFKQQEIHFNERNNNKNNNNNCNDNTSNTNINSSNCKSNNHCSSSNCNGNNNNNSNIVDNLDGTYTISANPNGGCCASSFSNYNKNNNNNQPNIMHQHQITNGGGCCAGNSNGRRFINVEKFIKQSNKYSQTNGSTENIPINMPQTHATPTTSTESTSYSLKSTASPQSLKSSVSALIEEKQDKKAENYQSLKTPPVQKSRTPEEAHDDDDNDANKCSTPTTTLVGSLHIEPIDNEVNSESPPRWAATAEQDLQLEDFVDLTLEDRPQASAAMLRRNTGSPLSLLSRTESIKTQLDGTPPVLSRSQSNKSMVTEEDIEENTSSFAIQGAEDVTEDVADDANKAKIKEEPNAVRCGSSKSNASARPHSAGVKPDPTDVTVESRQSSFDSPQQRRSKPCTPQTSAASRTHSPTIAELRTLSRRSSVKKSLDTLYDRSASTPKREDHNTTDTSSTSSTLSQLNQPPDECASSIKPQHTPLKQKAKSEHCLKKSSRRISPVSKRAINMTQPEMFPQTMTRFERPREALMKSFEQLDSTNWETNVLGLKTMVRLMRYHPETLDSNMHMVCIQLTKAVRNLRSQVSRAACQATTEIFAIKSKILEQECDDVVCGLLHRTADTNRFLRADATRALESMCDQLPPVKILNILTTKGAMHQHALVRTTTAKLLNQLVERLGCDKIYSMPRDQRDKFFVTGANLLLEGSLETRGYAKTLFRQLANHPSYFRLLVEVIPTRTYRNVEKVLKSIR